MSTIQYGVFVLEVQQNTMLMFSSVQGLEPLFVAADLTG
jgi:hypothetical protein